MHVHGFFFFFNPFNCDASWGHLIKFEQNEIIGMISAQG